MSVDCGVARGRLSLDARQEGARVEPCGEVILEAVGPECYRQHIVVVLGQSLDNADKLALQQNCMSACTLV